MGFKEWMFGIGIAVVLAIFVGYFSYEVSRSFENSCNAKLNGDGNTCVDKPESGIYCTSYQPECYKVRQDTFSVTALILGIIAMIVAFIIRENDVVSGGLIGGGIIAFIIALVGFWDRLEGWMRVAVAFVIAVTLIIVGLRKFKD